MGSNGAVLLTGDLGKEVYEEYSRLVDTRFERKGVLFHQFPNGFKRHDLMLDNDGTVQGCGSLSMCLMDEVLQRYGLRIVDLYDYQSLARMDHFTGESLKGMHLNLGLVLVANKWLDFQIEDRYHKGTKRIKQSLKRQLSEKGYPLTEPVYIPFSSLELKVDESSPFGLQLKLLDTDSINSSAYLVGNDSRNVLDSAIVHVKKADKQGLYDFKFYFNVICLAPTNVDDMMKPHHSMGPEKFDKMSQSYGRILVVPEDYDGDSFKALPDTFSR